MRRPFTAALAAVLVAAVLTVYVGQAAQRQQVPIPGAALIQPGQTVEFRPTIEPAIGRNVTVENRSGQVANVSLTGDGTLTISLPQGYRPELSGFLETMPSCSRPDATTIRCTSVFAPAGQFVVIAASSTATPTPTPAPPQSVPLPAGCTNVALTWPPGTALSVVASAIQPSGALESIFRLVAGQGRFIGYSPAAPAFVNDYTAIENRLEAVFICMRSPGTLQRPAP